MVANRRDTRCTRVCATATRCDSESRLPCAQELVEGPWRHNNLDAGAAMVIPVPLPLGGVVVVGEAVITYIDGGQPAKTVPLKATIVRVRARAHGAWSTCAHGMHQAPEHWIVLPSLKMPSGCARQWCRVAEQSAGVCGEA